MNRKVNLRIYNIKYRYICIYIYYRVQIKSFLSIHLSIYNQQFGQYGAGSAWYRINKPYLKYVRILLLLIIFNSRILSMCQIWLVYLLSVKYEELWLQHLSIFYVSLVSEPCSLSPFYHSGTIIASILAPSPQTSFDSSQNDNHLSQHQGLV